MADDVIVTIGADATDVDKNLQTLTAKVERHMSVIKNSILGALGAKVLGGAVKSSFEFIKGSFAESFDDSYRETRFKGLLGDLDRARDLAMRLELEAANGASSIESLADAGAALSTVFVDNNSIVDWVGRLSDISTGASVDLVKISRLFSRVMSQGYADMRGIEGLAKQGIPIWQALEKVIGASGKELRAMAAEGRIGSRDYMQALRGMTDEGGLYFNQSGAKSGTAGGTWNTLHETIGIIRGMMMQPLNDAITPVLNNIIAKLQDNLPAIEQWTLAFGPKFAANVAGMIAQLGAFGSTVGGLVDGTNEWSKALHALISVLLVMKIQGTQTFQTISASAVSNARSMGLAYNMQVAMMQGRFVGLRALATLTWAGIAASAKSACAVMATAFRATMVAVKSALISTGIGLVIWGIGEAVAYLYRQLAGVDEKMTDVFEKVDVAKLGRDIRRVDTGAGMEAMEDNLLDQIERQEALAKEAAEAGNETLAGRYDDQARALGNLLAVMREEAPARIAAAQAIERQKEQTAELSREEQRLIERQKQNLEQVGKMRQQMQQKDWEQQNGGLEIERRGAGINTRYGVAGIADARQQLEDLYAFSQSVGLMTDENRKRAEDLAVAIKLLDDLQKAQETHEKRTMATRTEHDLRIKAINAEIAGDEKRLAMIRERQKIIQYTEQYQSAGFAADEAWQMARDQAQKETLLDFYQRAQRDGSNGRNGKVEYIADSRARVGGGGFGVAVVTPELTEAKKQTTVQSAILQTLQNWRKSPEYALLAP